MLGNREQSTVVARIRSAIDAVRNWDIRLIHPNGWYLLAATLFCIATFTEIRLPGVQMDAVNPDYFVVHLLNPRAVGTGYWIVPGNLLFGRWPVLITPYHGALPFYLGLPGYALFGTDVIGIRLTHMTFGLLVLATAWLFMRSFGVRSPIAGLCLIGLALDPGFAFSFRSQYYITLLPIALVLVSVALTERRGAAIGWKCAAFAGVLAGVACYGYYEYLYLAPASFVHGLWSWRGAARRRIVIGSWISGFALGVSPYALGIALAIVATGGLDSFAQYLHGTLSYLGVTSSTLGVGGRLSLFIYFLQGTVLNTGIPRRMVGETLPLWSPTLKQILLLGIPALILAISILCRGPSRGLLLVIGWVLGLLVLVLNFGNRLDLHYVTLLLPIAYAALALALEWVASTLAVRSFAAAVAVMAALSPLFVGNAIDRQSVFQALRRTGGVGVYSDAINRFAEDSVKDTRPTWMLFPDWGVFMPFVMITRGTIPYWTEFSVAGARSVLCQGLDAVVVLVNNEKPERIEQWSAALDSGNPAMTTYTQRDGQTVLTVARWHPPLQPASGCRAPLKPS